MSITNLKINTTSDSKSPDGTYENKKNIHAINYLRELQKTKDNLTVLDVGGGCNIRIPEYTTHVLDFLPLREKAAGSNATLFQGDIELTDGWKEVFEYVEENGKFDFVVCAHTLEDINAPHQVILNLRKVADAGFICLPDKYVETCKWNAHGPAMGYGHHRWIYTIKNGKLYGYPKMGCLEYLDIHIPSRERWLEKYNLGSQTEMTFLWKNDFDFVFLPPYQYFDHFEFTENNRSILDDLQDRDDVCDYWE